MRYIKTLLLLYLHGGDDDDFGIHSAMEGTADDSGASEVSACSSSCGETHRINEA